MSLDANNEQNHQEEPQAVDYAPAGTRRPLVRRVLRHPLFWIVVVVLFVLFCPHQLLYDWGWQTDVCMKCGARRHQKSVSILSTTWQYDEQTIDGAVSRRIQAHLGQRCTHHWGLSEKHSQWFRGSFPGLDPYLCIGHVEGLPDCDAFLDKQIAKNPMFMQKLIQAVQSPLNHQTWWESLKAEAIDELALQVTALNSKSSPATSSPTSQPASQPAHSARQRDTN